MLLQNKVVMITGANGGLGGTVTRAFLDAGAKCLGCRGPSRILNSGTRNFTRSPPKSKAQIRRAPW